MHYDCVQLSKVEESLDGVRLQRYGYLRLATAGCYPLFYPLFYRCLWRASDTSFPVSVHVLQPQGFMLVREL